MNIGLQTFPESHAALLWTNGTGSTVTANTPVRVNGRLYIAEADIANGKEGVLAAAGKVKLAKGTGYTLTTGARWTWDGTKVVAWTPDKPTPPDGLVRKDAASGDTSAEVALGSIEAPWVFAQEVVVDSTMAAANSNDGQVDFVTGFGATDYVAVVQVRTVTTGRIKSAYDVLKGTGGSAGTLSVKGVAAGTQLDAGDIVSLVAHRIG